jgi:hypothetical protein
MKRLNNLLAFIGELIVVCLCMIFSGCASTPNVSGTIEGKDITIIPRMCYNGPNDHCIPESKRYDLVINGNPVPVYKDVWDRYEVGDHYP